MNPDEMPHSGILIKINNLQGQKYIIIWKIGPVTPKLHVYKGQIHLYYMDSSLTGGTALCPGARHFILCLVLLQLRKACPEVMNEKLLTGM